MPSDLAAGAAPRSARFDISTAFDRSGALTRPTWRALLREIAAIVVDRPVAASPDGLPHGAGRPVLVVPAFMTDDGYTATLRRFLTRCGFAAHGWELGLNWGPTPRLHAGLRQRLEEIHARAGEPVAVVGVSLGGLLARDLAHDHPDMISRVVTVVSPCRLPTASSIEPLFRLASRFYSTEIDAMRVSRPLPVPATSIFTREDGIVAWESCRVDGAEAVEVAGAHVTIASNPEALRAVVRSLADAAAADRTLATA